MKTPLALALAAATFAAAPASAAVYDAFTSFDGTQFAGGFIHTTVSDTFSNSQLLTANTNCFIAGSICLQAAPNFDVPGVTKSSVTSFQYNSVNVPTDRLLVHPGPTADIGSVAVTFIAPVGSFYRLDATFSIQDIHPTGIDVFLSATGIAGSFGVASLGAGNPSYSYSGTIYLAQGWSVAAVVNRAGNYGSDSTGLNLTLTAVPEPTSWAMLIAGFGLTGAALRRRRGLQPA
ncbi:hypothetical protein IP88_13450 [alpha proteobacterium AAP81b]|nr:hypothetical protein IP88_13450 [alpha proteobacterium AAP81b]